MRKLLSLGAALLLLAGALHSAQPAPPAPAGPLQIQLPLGRKAYQTNEWIDLALVRSAPGAIAASPLTLTLQGEDGSKLTFTFPLPAVSVDGKDARATEHFHLNGRLLRPGTYTLEAAADGTTAKTELELYSHIRKSTFRIGDWGSRAKGDEQAVMGEDSLGFNLIYWAYGGLSPDDTIRGGLDTMRNCTMSGAHQMDIRMECDWSDPYVLGGGTARVVRQAFADRTHPNCIGVHFYDEPGLTWHKHPKTGEMTPHNIPSQDRAFLAAFGREPLQYYDVKADNAEQFAQWQHWGRWKLSFMDAAWKHAAYGVNQVRADYLPVTQSVYGWNAYADGYYFNVARSLPVMSGHGGYDDYGLAYWNPSYTFEFGRMRDLAKPNWYLPSWYQGMSSDRFRLEQYLSFMNNLQGMMKPPDHIVHRPSKCRPTSDGIVESNHLMLRLGTVFTTMPVTRPQAAVLYSMSQNLSAQAKDMKDNYEGGKHGRQKTMVAYLAGQLNQTPLFPIVEEDILDGTLAAHHKAVFLPGVNYLDPKVITALEDYAKQGGMVLVSDDSQVQIKGATKLGAAVDIGFFEKLSQLWNDKKQEEMWRLNTAGNIMAAALPLAKALKGPLAKAGIRPAVESDLPSIMTSRQALGDVEYLFAVNATHDTPRGGMNSVKPATALLTIPAEGGTVYDAVTGGPVPEFKTNGKNLVGEFRFGPGQMRVFARTTQPIAGVQALTPTVFRDYTVAQDPLNVEVGAIVTGGNGRVLTGAIPLEVKLTDPLGVVRYDLYRATDRGIFKMKLPLAVNDPAGKWKVSVRELLSDKEDSVTFTTTAPAQCASVAGATARAVFFGNDRDNAYRLFQNHKDVTIAIGKSEYNQAAAERLEKALKPWNIRCKIIKAADVKARPIDEDEAFAWCGLEPGRVRPKLPAELAELLKSGPENFIKKFDKNGDGVLTADEVPPLLARYFDRFDRNNDKKLDKGEIAALNELNHPAQVGFDVRGAVVLLGTPEDNPLIDFLNKARFLPYKANAADFPGRGRGMVAWQRDGIGYGQESLTLIAYDAKGMGEAVGSLYEAAAGLDPLTQWVLPKGSSVSPANKAPSAAPEAAVAWKTHLPDRAAALKALPNGGLLVLSQDGSLTALDSRGKVEWQKPIGGGETWLLDASADGNVIVVGASQHIVAFDGKGKQLFEAPVTDAQPVPVVTFLAVSPDGNRVAAGAADGKLTLLENGKRQWAVGGVDPKDTKTKPNPYLAGAFASDGKSLVALTANEAHIISTADGKVSTKVGGVSGAIAPQRAGTNLMLSDGRSAVILSPTDGKVVKKVNLIGADAVSVALAGDEVVAGTEFDGAVRKFAASDAPKNPAVWEHKVPRRLVKKTVVQDGQTGVAYWGGLVQVLDAAGKVQAARTFPSDVADVQWTGKTLVVGLADGQVIALTAK